MKSLSARNGLTASSVAEDSFGEGSLKSNRVLNYVKTFSPNKYSSANSFGEKTVDAPLQAALNAIRQRDAFKGDLGTFEDDRLTGAV